VSAELAAQMEFRRQTAGLNLLSAKRGPARHPRLPTPRPDPRRQRSPRHPTDAAWLQPTRHRQLQPPWRSDRSV